MCLQFVLHVENYKENSNLASLLLVTWMYLDNAK